MIARAAVLIFPAAMAAAVMTALVVMVCADGIRVIEQCAVQQRIDRRVRAAGNTGIQLDARFCKRRARTAADAAADKRIHAVLLQKASQCTVAAAVCGRDLCIFNFAVLNLIDLKRFGMAEMLENQSVLIRYRDFHVHASFQIKYPIFCYVQNMLCLRLCRVSAFVIFRTAAPAMLRCAGHLLCRKRHARELAAEFFKRRAIDGVVHEITALFAENEPRFTQNF